MRGFDGVCENCGRETQIYYVCHVHEPFAMFCGGCGRADNVMHMMLKQEFREERVAKIYVRLVKEGTYDCFQEQSQIKRREEAFTRSVRGRTLQR